MTNSNTEYAQNIASPIEETNPKKWNQYVCGKRIYWRIISVTDSGGEKSLIRSAKVDCKNSSKDVGQKSSFVCDDSTIALWKFEETFPNDATIKDSCGKNNGVLIGTTSVKGMFGNARSFSGSNEIIDFGFVANPVNIKTIEAWVKFNSLTDGQEIISKSAYAKGIELLLWDGGLSFYVMEKDTTSIKIPYNKLNT